MNTDSTPSFTPVDHEVAYEQNVTGLEIAWRARIASFARTAVADLRATAYSGEAFEKTGLQYDAAEIVSARLLDNTHWENVKAIDISDIAYEAVGKIIDGQD